MRSNYNLIVNFVVHECRRRTWISSVHPRSEYSFFQRAAYSYLARSSTDSLEAPQSLGARIGNLPTRETMCQRVFNKMKEWFLRFLNYLSWELCSSSWSFICRSLHFSLFLRIFKHLVRIFQLSKYEHCYLSRRRWSCVGGFYRSNERNGVGINQQTITDWTLRS
jgi:hypothetical protein